MATYSLTIRQNKGSKLTIGELDDNFLYLEDLVSQGGGGSVDSGQIAFGGTASGLTSSSNFIYNQSSNNLIFGVTNSITGSSASVIMGGVCNTSNSNQSSILGGFRNTLNGTSSNSSIIGGNNNTLSDCSPHSSIHHRVREC